jgi:hypothetical protein
LKGLSIKPSKGLQTAFQGILKAFISPLKSLQEEALSKVKKGLQTAFQRTSRSPFKG